MHLFPFIVSYIQKKKKNNIQFYYYKHLTQTNERKKKKKEREKVDKMTQFSFDPFFSLVWTKAGQALSFFSLNGVTLSRRSRNEKEGGGSAQGGHGLITSFG